jgi:glycine dehydrogenase
MMDYGYHAPTVSFPVHESLMVEPTESESKQELDRFVEMMIAIKQELEDIKNGKADKADNLIANAPHTATEAAADEWNHPYTRQQAAFPLPWVAQNKFWPFVSKIDAGYGDRNLVCTCAPIEEYM